MKKNLLSLYIHWPYCMSKCPYCDFNSHVNETDDINLWIKSYTNQIFQMKEDIKKYKMKGLSKKIQKNSLLFTSLLFNIIASI